MTEPVRISGLRASYGSTQAIICVDIEIGMVEVVPLADLNGISKTTNPRDLWSYSPQ